MASFNVSILFETPPEFFIGPVGEFSSWLNLAIAIDYVAQSKNSALTLSQDNQSMFIGTITSSPSI